MDKDQVRLATSGEIEEVPEGFDLKGYIHVRAQKERDRRHELEEKYGDEIPLGTYNPIFVFALIECLLNMKEQHPDAFDALVEKFRNPDFEIQEKFHKEIESHGTFLNKKEDGSYKIDQLSRALFRESEKHAEGGFAGFIEMKLAQRIKNREKK